MKKKHYLYECVRFGIIFTQRRKAAKYAEAYSVFLCAFASLRAIDNPGKKEFRMKERKECSRGNPNHKAQTENYKPQTTN